MIIYLVIGLIAVSIISVITFLTLRKVKAKNDILTSLQQYGEVVVAKKECYDYMLTKNKTIFLVKVIYNFNKLEISVNNKNHWEINDKVVSSKKSGTKLQGIYDLINNKDFPFELPYKKVYLIYPSSKVLLKAVNESELTFIYPSTDCYGVNLIKYDELTQAINEI